MTADEASLRAYFYANAKTALLCRGADVTSQYIGRDGFPFTRLSVMTDAGRLSIHLHHDGLAGNFERPILAKASPIIEQDELRYSIELSETPTLDKAKVDGSLEKFAAWLTKINARTQRQYRSVMLTPAEYDATGIEALRDRATMGERFEISGFDQEGWIAAYLQSRCSPSFSTGGTDYDAINMRDIEPLEAYYQMRTSGPTFPPEADPQGYLVDRPEPGAAV